MKSILEKAIVHLLNGDEGKAETLFHKFMVERARQIHESLRQDQDVELTEGWDSEIKEEEYYNDGDIDDEPADDADNAGGDLAGDDISPVGTEPQGDDEDFGGMGGDADAEGDDLDVDADPDADLGGDAAEGGMEGKLDDIEAKIEELTAEFDRLMSTLEDDDDLGDEGDEFTDMGDDLGGEGDVEGSDGADEGDTDVSPEPDEAEDLGGQIEDDLGDDDTKEHPEDAMAEGDDFDDDDLADVTESVLSELDRISAPANRDGKEIGTGGTISGNRNDGALPKHSAADRVNQAKPVMVKAQGDAHNDSFERESSPPTKGVDSVVKGVRNSRKSFKNDMSTKSKDGDSSAELNKDFAPHSEGKPIIDGKKRK